MKINKLKKFKKLEILNFEGPVLVGYRYNDTFVIADEWGVLVNILSKNQMSNFIEGKFPIIDSNGKSWLYTNEHSSAKRSNEEVADFIHNKGGLMKYKLVPIDDHNYNFIVNGANVGNIVLDFDGYYYYTPGEKFNSIMSSYFLKTIADCLDDLNKDYDDHLKALIN
jgi:hypothetical protein